ncbi:unnamed protein product [Amoebophrya sp. A120]|nr:unnamed protein product [Amoebophrya sp. A120]|eukprot:GSA120T00008533001.1
MVKKMAVAASQPNAAAATPAATFPPPPPASTYDAPVTKYHPKVAIVTSGTRGIGFELVSYLLEARYTEDELEQKVKQVVPRRGGDVEIEAAFSSAAGEEQLVFEDEHLSAIEEEDVDMLDVELLDADMVNANDEDDDLLVQGSHALKKKGHGAKELSKLAKMNKGPQLQAAGVATSSTRSIGGAAGAASTKKRKMNEKAPESVSDNERITTVSRLSAASSDGMNDKVQQGEKKAKKAANEPPTPARLGSSKAARKRKSQLSLDKSPSSQRSSSPSGPPSSPSMLSSSESSEEDMSAKSPSAGASPTGKNKKTKPPCPCCGEDCGKDKPVKLSNVPIFDRIIVTTLTEEDGVHCEKKLLKAESLTPEDLQSHRFMRFVLDITDAKQRSDFVTFLGKQFFNLERLTFEVDRNRWDYKKHRLYKDYNDLKQRMKEDYDMDMECFDSEDEADFIDRQWEPGGFRVERSPANRSSRSAQIKGPLLRSVDSTPFLRHLLQTEDIYEMALAFDKMQLEKYRFARDTVLGIVRDDERNKPMKGEQNSNREETGTSTSFLSCKQQDKSKSTSSSVNNKSLNKLNPGRGAKAVINFGTTTSSKANKISAAEQIRRENLLIDAGIPLKPPKRAASLMVREYKEAREREERQASLARNGEVDYLQGVSFGRNKQEMTAEEHFLTNNILGSADFFLINNAGVLIDKWTAEACEKQLLVNCVGHLDLTERILELLFEPAHTVQMEEVASDELFLGHNYINGVATTSTSSKMTSSKMKTTTTSAGASHGLFAPDEQGNDTSADVENSPKMRTKMKQKMVTSALLSPEEKQKQAKKNNSKKAPGTTSSGASASKVLPVRKADASIKKTGTAAGKKSKAPEVGAAAAKAKAKVVAGKGNKVSSCTSNKKAKIIELDDDSASEGGSYPTDVKPPLLTYPHAVARPTVSHRAHSFQVVCVSGGFGQLQESTVAYRRQLLSLPFQLPDDNNDSVLGAFLGKRTQDLLLTSRLPVPTNCLTSTGGAKLVNNELCHGITGIAAGSGSNASSPKLVMGKKASGSTSSNASVSSKKENEKTASKSSAGAAAPVAAAVGKKKSSNKIPANTATTTLLGSSAATTATNPNELNVEKFVPISARCLLPSNNLVRPTPQPKCCTWYDYDEHLKESSDCSDDEFMFDFFTGNKVVPAGRRHEKNKKRPEDEPISSSSSAFSSDFSSSSNDDFSESEVDKNHVGNNPTSAAGADKNKKIKTTAMKKNLSLKAATAAAPGAPVCSTSTSTKKTTELTAAQRKSQNRRDMMKWADKGCMGDIRNIDGTTARKGTEESEREETWRRSLKERQEKEKMKNKKGVKNSKAVTFYGANSSYFHFDDPMGGPRINANKSVRVPLDDGGGDFFGSSHFTKYTYTKEALFPPERPMQYLLETGIQEKLVMPKFCTTGVNTVFPSPDDGVSHTSILRGEYNDFEGTYRRNRFRPPVFAVSDLINKYAREFAFLPDNRQKTYFAGAYKLSLALLNRGVQLMAEWFEHLEEFSITAVCPGWCRTRLGSGEATRSPQEGAESICAALFLLGEELVQAAKVSGGEKPRTSAGVLASSSAGMNSKNVKVIQNYIMLDDLYEPPARNCCTAAAACDAIAQLKGGPAAQELLAIQEDLRASGTSSTGRGGSSSTRSSGTLDPTAPTAQQLQGRNLFPSCSSTVLNRDSGRSNGSSTTVGGGSSSSSSSSSAAGGAVGLNGRSSSASAASSTSRATVQANALPSSSSALVSFNPFDISGNKNKKGNSTTTTSKKLLDQGGMNKNSSSWGDPTDNETDSDGVSQLQKTISFADASEMQIPVLEREWKQHWLEFKKKFHGKLSRDGKELNYYGLTNAW